VATLPEHRRHGLARRLVAACQEFVRADGGFRVIYLHTNTRVPAAEPFWRSLPVVEIRDDRGEEHDPRFATVHFELPLDVPVA
jgi:GNAT superfamily N-acetyltransferase